MILVLMPKARVIRHSTKMHLAMILSGENLIFSLLTAEDFCFFCDLCLQFIASINLWNKCIDLRLFLKCKEGPFLRSLRSNDD